MATKRETDVIAALTGAEAREVLRALLRAHPDLGPEARAIATQRLERVDVVEVAEAVVEAVQALGFDELNGRAGRQAYGYVEPEEAAWDLLEEALAPFTDEIERLLHPGLEEAARAQVEGVLLGLRDVRNEQLGDILEYAPDFPAEAAETALRTWMYAPGGPRRFDEDFLYEELEEWADLVARVEATPPT